MMSFDSSCDLFLEVISVLQRYKTDISTSIGWCANMKYFQFLLEIFVKSVKSKMLLQYFLW